MASVASTHGSTAPFGQCDALNLLLQATNITRLCNPRTPCLSRGDVRNCRGNCEPQVFGKNENAMGLGLDRRQGYPPHSSTSPVRVLGHSDRAFWDNLETLNLRLSRRLLLLVGLRF